MIKYLITDERFITDKQMYDAMHEKYICFSETGILINKKTFKIVGKLDVNGYITTAFNDKTIGVHRIIFCMVHGYLPKIVDHLNRDRSDNRIENLREISATGNSINSKVSKNHISGIKGITWSTDSHCWKVAIIYKGKSRFLGHFRNFINAVKARHYAEEKLGYAEYDFMSNAKKYLLCSEKLKVYSNSKIEEEEFSKFSVENEWEFFLLTKKEKIDKLLEK